MQEKVLACIYVASFINWGNPFEEVSENNFDLSVVLMSVGHHEKDLALKSPVITVKHGLLLHILLKGFSKSDKNKLPRVAINNRHYYLFTVVSHF